MPGMAASTRLTFEFGSAPNAVEAPENSLASDLTWACTSMPMITSQSPVAPGIRRLGSGVRVSMRVMEVRSSLQGPEARARHKYRVSLDQSALACKRFRLFGPCLQGRRAIRPLVSPDDAAVERDARAGLRGSDSPDARSLCRRYVFANLLGFPLHILDAPLHNVTN